mgnify:CR=1 FL=1
MLAAVITHFVEPGQAVLYRGVRIEVVREQCVILWPISMALLLSPTGAFSPDHRTDGLISDETER